MRLVTLLAVVSAVLLGCPGGGSPDGGDPDSGAGDAGQVDAGLLPITHNAVGYAVTVQGGKAVAVGTGGARDDVRVPDQFLARVNADGTLDPAFGGRGFVHYDFDGGTMSLASFTEDGALAVMADGDKLVTAGYARGIVTVPAGAVTIAPFNADGSLDTTFNTRGYALCDFNPMSHVDNAGAAYAVAKRSDGKYVFAGGLDNGVSRGRDIFAYRINADGSVDNTFSIGTPLHFGGSETATDIVLQGNLTVLGGGEDFTLCRLTDTGMLDVTFGTAGSVKSTGGTMYKLLARGDGRLLGVGLRSVDVGLTSERLVLKLFQTSADGVPDATFGTLGVVELDAMRMGVDPAGDLRGAALAADGSLLLLTINLSGSRVYKLRPDGSLDTTWGTGGAKPSGLQVSILSLLLAQPRGANALAIDGSDIWITGSTLIDLSPGNTVARFAITRIGL